ncbi:MATE family efflux transporter [Agarilytica rhodophyticola]|uniref:MATE family efflux transporter n=1 Tax=Agarilytica rhodophyticola TaxID=1737490 RepID=UPI00131A0534|nr:MATE family efflux transporter [Agarilytica rhodophyticola]
MALKAFLPIIITQGSDIVVTGTLKTQPTSLKTRVRNESRSLFSLGGPILMVQLLQVAVVTMDTVMAGRYDARDLSGVAIGGSMWFPIFLFLTGLLSALTPTVAQLHGAKRYEEIPKQVFQSAWIVLFVTPFTMLLLMSLSPVLVLIGADDAIRPIANGYLNAMIWGLLPVLLYNVLRFYSDGVSLTKPAVMASVIGLVCNAFLNYGLIYGKFGLPEMGGIGCGWASAISFYIMFFYMAVVVLTKKAYLPFKLSKVDKIWDWPSLRSLLRLGIPIGSSHFIESSMFAVIALFLAPLNPTVVAAHQIALNCSALLFMIPLSLSMALTIRIGFFIGSDQVFDARFTAYYGIFLALAYAVFSGIMLYNFRFQIAELYNSQPEVIALSSTLLLYAAAFQLGDAFQVTAAGALRGYKDTKITMYIMFVTFWFFGLPLGYILGLTSLIVEPMYAQGFWFGLVIGLLMAGIILIMRLRVISTRYCLGTLSRN